MRDYEYPRRDKDRDGKKIKPLPTNLAAPIHLQKGQKVNSEEKALMLQWYFKERRAIDDIAWALHRLPGTVRKYIQSMMSTTDQAEQLLKASAERLAARVIINANVDQALDVLERPNIGVLQPVNKNAERPAVFISVNQESLGGLAPSITTLDRPAESATIHAIGPSPSPGPGTEEGARHAARPPRTLSSQERRPSRLSGKGPGRRGQESQDGRHPHA